MKDLSLHILDIAHNSIAAGASRVVIELDEGENMVSLTVTDNGRGMDAELLARVTDPFTTTRTTRRVGLGLSLLKLAAEQAGGLLTVESGVGVGTTLRAGFLTGHLDTPPIGDLPATMVALVHAAPGIDFLLTHRRAGLISDLDVSALREVLGEVPLDGPDVLNWIEQSLRESEEALMHI